MSDYKDELSKQIVEYSRDPKRKKENRSGRIFGGSVLVVIGAVFLARQLGFEFAWWLFTWQTFLIVLGVYIGARHSFRGVGWIFPIAVGGIFMIQDFYPGLSIGQYLWPIMIILFGLFMILRPRRHHEEWNWDPKTSTEDFVDATSIFGGTKRLIISKNFKGADITNIFGGAELDLTQADIQGKVTLDITQVFGGTKLLVPAHWNVKSDIVCVFGGIDDKRPQNSTGGDGSKVLQLDGTCVFGGIEIKSY